MFHVINASIPPILLNLLLKSMTLNLNTINTEIHSFDQYICKTCNNYVRKLKIPGYAVVNNSYFEEIPEKLLCLDTFELMLIAKRLLFKIIIMQKGQTLLLHDFIHCEKSVQIRSFFWSVFSPNKKIYIDSTWKQLPKQENCSEVILVKLKRACIF